MREEIEPPREPLRGGGEVDFPVVDLGDVGRLLVLNAGGDRLAGGVKGSAGGSAKLGIGRGGDAARSGKLGIGSSVSSCSGGGSLKDGRRGRSSSTSGGGSLNVGGMSVDWEGGGGGGVAMDLRGGGGGMFAKAGGETGAGAAIGSAAEAGAGTSDAGAGVGSTDLWSSKLISSGSSWKDSGSAVTTGISAPAGVGGVILVSGTAVKFIGMGGTGGGDLNPLCAI